MIKCFESNLDHQDIVSVNDCMQSGILGFGSKVKEFETRYASLSKRKYNIGMNSASAAAYAIFSYLFKQHGKCDVYTPSLGFTSPSWAAKKNGHNVIFVDINKDLLFDTTDYYIKRSRFSTGNTTVVMPVLYGGVSKISNFELFGDEIIVLDSAHCISPNMEYDYAFFSFHPVKPICMSNGGILATDNLQAKEFFEIFRNFGRQDKNGSYDIVGEGFNFYMNNLNASLGLSQLEKCMDSVQKRKENFLYLRDNMPETFGRFVDHDEASSYYLATLIINEAYDSLTIRQHFEENCVQATYHYPSLHKTEYYDQKADMPNLDEVEDGIINLPIHQNLTKQELNKIVEVAKYWDDSCREDLALSVDFRNTILQKMRKK
jgi:dTDP-4-amino-4,6-dideoxygalactose transaminase